MKAAGALRAFARLFPVSVAASEDLERAITFLGWPVEPETVRRASYGVGLCVVGLGAAAAGVLPARYRVSAALGAVACGALAAHAVRAYPRVRARTVRTRSLGAAPALVARVVLRMRLSPSPEQAAAVAASTGRGRLAASLRRHHERARHAGRSGLAAFGETWGGWFPALERAIELVVAAGSTPAERRDGVLDDALATVLEGTSDEVQSFAATVRGPATAVYAFGVLLPTALVALLPAAATAGIGVSPVSVGIVYGVVFPGGLAVACVWLLARRPVAFPPPGLGPDHRSVADRRRSSLLVGGAAAALGWWIGGALGTTGMAPTTAVGAGAGAALIVRYRPVLAVYDRIEAAEATLPEALSLIGRHVSEGVGAERAVAETAESLDGPLSELLEAASRRQRRLGEGLREALLGHEPTVRSPRLRDGLEAIVRATEDGRPAGEALLAFAEHLDALENIEREARHRLAYVCRTLHSTGAAFAPLVAGTTVALAEGVETGALAGEEITWLGGIVGWYVLALAAVLPALATGLTRGLDRALVGYRVGRSLIAASGVFLCSYLLGGGLV